ncbi:helix-turn-helix domain-containing protein [Holdemanella biformis]|uniref:AlbA family DNA-binding domain-containing protein n=1 Tax=Holdemanella biformis TaxID=1735 RepID=UPI0039F57B1E
MCETRILEFKETVTNTFLKTVSAFSNYDGGEILFGVDDDGNIKGLSDVKQACLDIEIEPLTTEVTRFLGAGFYRHFLTKLSSQSLRLFLLLANLLICLASIY